MPGQAGTPGPDHPVVQPAELAERASAAAGRPVRDLVPLQGGASSLTFRARWADGPASEPLVLKVAPPGVPPVRNRDVLRQAKVLRSLAKEQDVLVPEVLFEDAGTPPDVPPLFGMSFVAGESLDPNIDPDITLPAPADVTGRARHAAETLAALHRTDLARTGLDGEPAGTLPAEIDRWVRAFGTVPDDLRPGADAVAEQLGATVPRACDPVLLHGDYRLGNTLCEGSRLRAVIDWEIWSIGDPRLDLAWFLLTADPDAHPSAQRRAPGMPGPDELRAVYADAGGPSTENLEWFEALALFKLAAASALIAKNARRRGETSGFGARAAEQVPDMIARARTALV
ncbi:phosphotransferase [Actinomadura sp. LD22]|uniref:Phosphotransferase n=1 Tax=Actinomadura physcomitrii TaxID=2650748 RepID=A0A6I4M957_9ACTN|nr:phosphotransferase family protein [Actinomadura physcomitrii]MWA00945.1 phosphotransferase [Actinomadura physcomitrii]